MSLYDDSRRELAAYEAQDAMNSAASFRAREAVAPLVAQVAALQAALLQQAKDLKAIQTAVAALKAQNRAIKLECGRIRRAQR